MMQRIKISADITALIISTPPVVVIIDKDGADKQYSISLTLAEMIELYDKLPDVIEAMQEATNQ